MPKLKKDNDSNPRVQKVVLLIFGIGPIFLMGWFLASKGFFETSNF